jgi:hypothetical protein
MHSFTLRGKAPQLYVLAGSKLHVAHAFTRSLQQVSRISEQRPVEEADVDVIFERVDVAEGRIVAAGGGGRAAAPAARYRSQRRV